MPYHVPLPARVKATCACCLDPFFYWLAGLRDQHNKTAIDWVLGR